MKHTWVCRKKMKIWLEIGLAVALAFCMGIAGAKLCDVDAADEKKAEMQRMAEEENQSAKQKVEAVSEEEADGKYQIMGESSVTAEDLAEYFQSEKAVYPSEALAKGGADSLEVFCEIYCEEAKAEGVRPEVAFAQTMKETGWLQFGGDASIEQFNFAGIGTTGGGVPGNSYPDVRTGVRAQIQHLKAYATTDTLKQECVDDRYEYVIKGSAPYVEWLGKYENPEGQGWATAKNYGPSIVEMIQQMKN